MPHVSQKGGMNLEKKVVICHFSKPLVKKETSPFSLDIEPRGCTIACHFDKKKCYRIPFENVPIKQIPPSSVVSCPGELTNQHEESTQTPKPGCHCFPKSSKVTSVKVCTFPIIMYTYTCRNTFYYTDSVLEN